jgi:hypothetical protein
MEDSEAAAALNSPTAALTSPQTFSAAMNFATRLERETDALFVGEPTGGAPNHRRRSSALRRGVCRIAPVAVHRVCGRRGSESLGLAATHGDTTSPTRMEIGIHSAGWSLAV